MNFERKVYTFSRKATIGPHTGPVHVEMITSPIKSCPQATHRVVARYIGKVKRGTPITVDGAPYVVHRMFTGARAIPLTHFFCARVDAPEAA